MIVGVTLCLDPGLRIRPGREYVYLSRAYLSALARAGACPIALSPDAAPESCAELCSGLVISGGGDLPRSFTDEDLTQFSPAGEAEVRERSLWERSLIDAFGTRDKPILGVCYGMQLLGLHFGGTLFRNVHDEVPTASDHGAQERATKHLLTCSAQSWLLSGLSECLLTNSSHLQAVRDMPAGFRVTAQTPDGVIEAFESTTHSIAGVQWHPEADATGQQIYENFVGRIRSTARSASG